ncbi:MAG TPA: sensor histidine kinase [bacterium]|nr:sensor histidine kinase [bacterium]
MKSKLIHSIIKPVKDSLSNLELDIALGKKMTAEESRGFQEHCNRLTIAGLYICGITTSLGAVVPWFTDFLLFDLGSPFFRAMQYFRASILLLSLVVFLILRFSRTLTAHPYYLGLVAFSAIMAIGGRLVAGVGGFDSSFAYAVYTTPMLSVMLFVPYIKRLIAAFAILVSYFVSLFVFAPDQFDLSIVGTPITWSIASAFAAFAAGHVIYLVLRTNFLQRRKLNDLTVNLQDRVAEQTEKIRQLTTAVFNVQEQERNRIAHDLHDELGQMLVRMDMEVQLLKKTGDPKKKKAGSFEQGIGSLHALVNRLHNTLDRILGALKPILLENQGFDVAVTSMVDDLVKGRGIKAEVLFETDVDFFSDTANTALFRIVQEGMTNIVKHAEATGTIVKFEEKDDKLELSVIDNGKGFDPDEVPAKNRLGLKGIGERVKLMGGELKIESKQNCGTTISIVLPLEKLQQGVEK